MKISTFKYFVIDALKSLKRNKTVSFASSATVAATLFILGVFLLLVFNVNQGIKELGSKVEVKVYLKKDISTEDKEKIQQVISKVEGVKEIVHESQSEALEKVKEQFGKDAEILLKGFDKENPFPESYIVKVEKPEIVDKVVKSVDGLSGIYKVKDARKLVDKITKITNTLKFVGAILFCILIGVSLFLIGNTIKITVYSRKKEIGIMKYVGATDWFIRWPFIIEGVIMGVIGAIFSGVLLYYAYNFLYVKTTTALLGEFSLISPYYILSVLIWEFVLGGIIIGAVGSIMSIRKFLVV